MELGKLAGIFGAAATVITGSVSWAVNTSESVSKNESELGNLKTTVIDLRSGINDVHKQNVQINSKLTDILHKQDKRLELLEYRVSEAKHGGAINHEK